ncbi:translation initiation factor IF-2-like [Corvus kubaryi]|uniref:translation initiation factor IF-2-like n=1 Tax=Corvus kubaryi TaxID=68294 RepID=UPI001C03F02E|nr:translation initiation factor IF-2-like [Corvus kubaryi]
MADLALSPPPCLQPPSIPQGCPLSPPGPSWHPPFPSQQKLTSPSPNQCLTPGGTRSGGVWSLIPTPGSLPCHPTLGGGVCATRESPLSPSHRGGDLLCPGWSQLPSQGPTLYSWGRHSVPRYPSLCPGCPRSHWGPVLGGPPSLSEGATLYPSYPTLHAPFRGSPLPTGSSLCPGVPLLPSGGSHSLLPVVLLPPPGDVFSLEAHPPPLPGVPLYSRGFHSLPGGPVSCSRAPAAPRGPHSPARGVPLLSPVTPAPHRGVAAGSPRTRGAAAAARGGAGGGAGAHPRCRWRGGAAAPSPIKRAAAPVPQRGRGSP